MRDRAIAEGGQDNPDRYARPAVRSLYPALDDDLEAVVEQFRDEMLPEWYPGYARGVAPFLERQQVAAAASIYAVTTCRTRTPAGRAPAGGMPPAWSSSIGAASTDLRRADNRCIHEPPKYESTVSVNLWLA